MIGHTGSRSIRGHSMPSVYYFEVEQRKNRLPFPLDMLRYDRCFPVGNEAVASMGESVDTQLRKLSREEEADLLRVELASLCKPSQDHWASFGWDIAGPVRKVIT